MNEEPPVKGFYERILPEADQPLSTPEGEAKLRILAEAMTDEGPWNSTDLPAGYTYLGQFIDHELTWNRAILDPTQPADGSPPLPLANFRSSRLDLDHVYGEGPSGVRSASLYAGEPGAELFKIGPTKASASPQLPGGTLHDFVFDGDVPLIGDGFDRRNAENLILRQLHILFLKFHNKVVAELPNHGAEPALPAPADGSLFERARLLVTWTYQYIIWHEFLGKVTNSYDRRLDEAPESVGIEFHLPIEFAHAVFRYGHSMVRDRYPLNFHHDSSSKPGTDIGLEQLINPDNDRAERLEEQFVIEWGRFFDSLTERPVVKARKIDSHITAVLRSTAHLPLMTLLRGGRGLLASGQQAHQPNDCNLTVELAVDGPLQAAGLTTNTPLWYYILKEAEVCERGERLGDVGSRIVCLTIKQALQHDPRSFLNRKGPDWRPPTWIIPVDYKSNISQVIEFAGAIDTPQRSNDAGVYSARPPEVAQ